VLLSPLVLLLARLLARSLVILPAAAIPLAHAEPVDRMLYAFQDRIITEGDLAFDIDLDPHDQSAVPALEAPGYAAEQRIVDLTIIRALAGDTLIYRPTPEEVEVRWERVRASWARAEDFDAFLTRWGLDGDALRGLLYSRMVSEQYIRRVAATHDVPAETEAFAPIYQEWIAEIRAKAQPRRAP
jgi:hypothetical protein